MPAGSAVADSFQRTPAPDSFRVVPYPKRTATCVCEVAVRSSSSPRDFPFLDFAGSDRPAENSPGPGIGNGLPTR